MHDFPFSDDQRDALQEITNIGMGQAGARLAELLDTFVSLSVPRVRLVDVNCLSEAVRSMLGFSESITAFRQGFRCNISGEAITLLNDNGADYLYEALYGETLNGSSDGQGVPVNKTGELLAEVSNLLTGACLTSLFEQIGLIPSFSAPRLIGMQLKLDDLLMVPAKLTWERALLIEVHLHIAERDFKAHLLTLMTADSVQKLCNALDAFLANL
ncbi:chemotaxis protein CheC [Crenobacter sp. SG2303]|uniref:Chemotaxis protein CheC n=1 Tax=Crenobacter oryzisoli TaxID=3056844 RepID=A0ABT7XRT4_9NEIS|nr:chemotaxis protein CheC [Crenobacter sp. SG2303]MDN0076418.1 chemotaxis protein CheC [Crenobacter sp. SG2303]